MKIVKRVGRLQPRDSVDFYKRNPSLYKKLKRYQEIEVPDDEVKNLSNIRVVRDKSIEIKRTKKTKLTGQSFGDKLESYSHTSSE